MHVSFIAGSLMKMDRLTDSYEGGPYWSALSTLRSKLSRGREVSGGESVHQERDLKVFLESQVRSAKKVNESDRAGWMVRSTRLSNTSLVLML